MLNRGRASQVISLGARAQSCICWTSGDPSCCRCPGAQFGNLLINVGLQVARNLLSWSTPSRVSFLRPARAPLGSIEHCPPQRPCAGTMFDGQFGPIELFRVGRRTALASIFPIISAPVITRKTRTPHPYSDVNQSKRHRRDIFKPLVSIHTTQNGL